MEDLPDSERLPSAHAMDEPVATPRRTWNYRVMSFRHGEDAWLAIHEVHYQDGMPIAYTESPAVVMWDTEDGTIAGGMKCLERMKEALLKPVLTEADFRK